MALPLEEWDTKSSVSVQNLQHCLPFSCLLHPRSVSWLGMSPVGKKTHQTTNKTKETQHSALVEIREKQSALRHASPKETRKYLWVFSAASPLGTLSLITSAESCDQCTQEKGCPCLRQLGSSPCWGVKVPVCKRRGCLCHTHQSSDDCIIIILQLTRGRDL